MELLVGTILGVFPLTGKRGLGFIFAVQVPCLPVVVPSVLLEFLSSIWARWVGVLEVGCWSASHGSCNGIGGKV